MEIDSLSVIIPVYNSADILPVLLQRLDAVLPNLAPQFEVILVNDGSRDSSWDAILRLTQKYPWAYGIHLMRNYGQHNALLCGIRVAKHPIIVTMDDDLQHPPEEIPKLLNKLADGHDVVYGTPENEQHGLWRDLASQITKLAMQASMGIKTARDVSAFRVFHTRLRDAFADYSNPYVSIDVLLAWGTAHFAAVKVRSDLRLSGKSNYTFAKLVTHAINMMTGFSTLPLQLAIYVGFTFTLFGIGVFCYVVGRYLILGYSVPGFPFLASIIAIFSGAQLFALGIIGEYLARIHSRVMNRPAYVVGSTISQDRIDNSA
ncbi:MAG: glycosyltransferase family 2 protein [Anaerolineae bacterium]|nr:glycosyltransferase family 2 protein [Anaerolineae bacterium]